MNTKHTDTQDITILAELQAYIDPLTSDEYEALERSILAEGCRDALVLWGNVLVDGHNRYSICRKHGLPFKVIQNTHFQNMDDIHLWMIDQHLGRRSVSDYQRGVLALRKREIIAERRAVAAAAVQTAKAQTENNNNSHSASAQAPWDGETDPVVAQALAQVPKVPEQVLDTRDDLARAARLSPTQVKMIETIQQKAAPQVVAAVKAGELSLNAAATIATLPVDEQTAVAAEGAEGLKQAAKRVREARKKTKPAVQQAVAEAVAVESGASAETMQVRIAELEAENERLRLQVKTLQELLAEQS